MRARRGRGAVVLLVTAGICGAWICLHLRPRLWEGHREGRSLSAIAGTSYLRGGADDGGASSHASEPWTCPHEHQRTTLAELRSRAFKPYLFGGTQRPACANCRRSGELWATFCQFKGMGPACPEWDQQALIDGLLARAEAGAAGAADMLTFTPCDLFRTLEGRTLWLIGDSMTQELMRAMQCFLYEFWPDLATHDPRGLTTDQQAVAAFSKLDTGWCASLAGRTRLCHLRSNYGATLATDVLPNLRHLGARPSDVALLNFGVWHNDAASLRAHAAAVAAYLPAARDSLPFLVWRETAPQHFATPLGEFACEGCPEPAFPYECQAVEGVSLAADNSLQSADPGKAVLLGGGWRNAVTSPLMRALGIPVLAIWNQSLPLWQQHHHYNENGDCTHMCHPSAYQVWIWQLHQLLLEHRGQLPPVT